MEMKDKLKKLRQDRGLTQAQLAQALFVSRSTVAKWENGLGLPSPESMEMLEQQYGITREDVATSEPETVIVEKNRKLRRIGRITQCVLVAALLVLSVLLPIGIIKGEYGFTSDMAVGAEPGAPYIQAGRYRIYYDSLLTFTEEDGSKWEYMNGTSIAEKHFWGWTVAKNGKAYTTRVITRDGYVIGKIRTLHDRDGYYHLLCHQLSNQTELDLFRLTHVRFDGALHQVEKGFFFTSQEDISGFFVGEQFYSLEP